MLYKEENKYSRSMESQLDKIRNNDESRFEDYKLYNEEERRIRNRKLSIIVDGVVIVIVLVVAAIIYIFTYKSSIVDPIKDIKDMIIFSHIGLIVALLMSSIFVSIFSNNAASFISREKLVLLLEVLTLIAFLGITVYMNLTYTSDKFEEIYDEEYRELETKSKKQLSLKDIDIANMKIKPEKEKYIEECNKLYSLYNIKTYFLLILNLVVIVILKIQKNKISVFKEKKDQVARDDIVLFDEEENVKI